MISYKKPPLCFPTSPVSSPSKGNQYPELLNVVLPALELHINETTQCLLFIVWVFLLNIVCDSSEFNPSYLYIIFHYVKRPQFIHSTVDAHLGCFPFGAIMNSAGGHVYWVYT